MKLTIISNDGDSQVSYSRANPSVTMRICSTLRPICLAHEISHVRLGQITQESIDWRRKSYANLLLQELACWVYVLALNRWDTKDIRFIIRCLEATIRSLEIRNKVSLAIYQAFKNEYLTPRLDTTSKGVV